MCLNVWCCNMPLLCVCFYLFSRVVSLVTICCECLHSSILSLKCIFFFHSYSTKVMSIPFLRVFVDPNKLVHITCGSQAAEIFIRNLKCSTLVVVIWKNAYVCVFSCALRQPQALEIKPMSYCAFLVEDFMLLELNFMA